MSSARVRAAAALCAIALGACSSPPDEPQPGCNPLIGDDCVTPFPSSFHEVADPTSPTGVRLAIPDDTVEVMTDVPLSAARLRLRDGASPATPFIVYFAGGVDASQLPGKDDADRTLRADSPIQIVDMASGARVPLWAELDANAAPGQKQALLLHPARRLDAGRRYAVALVALHDAAGGRVEPAPFRALRDRGPLSHALEAMSARMEEVFAALEAAGVPRASLSLAWDLHTGSDANQTGHLLQMRDEALADVGTLGWKIATSTDYTIEEDADRLREIVGTFDVPWYLESSAPTALLQRDAAGNPVRNGLGTANFVVEIPRCAATATGPIPVVYYGHGLFGNAKDELDTAYQRHMNGYLCMVQIATDWIGLATADIGVIASAAGADLNNLAILTDRLQQAHVDAQVLVRLFLTRMKDDPAFAVGGRAVTDGSEAYYFGISDGGIQGGTFMALSQDITRGVLNVPGAEWSLLIFRSADFNAIRPLFGILVPDPLAQQLAFALTQPEWDFTDPISFAPHLLADPLPGSPPKHVLLQEGIGDAQVANVATRVLARTIGVPGLDLVQPVDGIAPQAAPLDSAYTQWDVSPSPLPPDTNTALDADNQTHEGVRRLPAVQAQIKAFLAKDGAVTDQCGGAPCVFPSAPTSP